MKDNKRIFLLDNAKAFLILLVVIGHFIEPVAETSDKMKSLFIFIYTFHIPAFIMLSGLTHRVYQAGDSFRRDRFFGFLFGGFALKFCVSIVRLIFFDVESFKLLSEGGIPWYLLVLAAYELIAYLMRGFKPQVVITMSVLLSFVVGMDASVGDWLILSRMLVYLPYFLLGYYLRVDQVVSFYRKLWVKIVSLILVVAYGLFCILDVKVIYPYRRLFTGKNSFEYTREVFSGAGIQARILVFVLALVIGFAIIAIMPDRRIPLLSKMGKNTLQIYFWHRIVIYILSAFGSLEMISVRFGAMGNIGLIAMGIVCTIVLMIPIFRHPMAELMNLTKKE